jgi:hypothetical protein
MTLLWPLENEFQIIEKLTIPTLMHLWTSSFLQTFFCHSLESLGRGFTGLDATPTILRLICPPVEFEYF